MSRGPLAIDAAIAVVIALIIIVLSPGAAIDAILVLVLLAACGLGALIARRRGHGSLVPRVRRRPSR